nr:hypothetical protein [Tanacetum cinerariifolium]
MGDTTAQTRFESISKHFNDSLLARGNTLQSDEDKMKLNELMALCTTLHNRVLELEKTRTSQHNKIASLKRRVKKLEKRNRSRTHKLKRFDKVGLTARVESLDDEESLGGEEVFAAAGQNENDKGKGIMIEEPMKPKKKDLIRLDKDATKSTKKQKVEDDKEKAELKQLMETIPDEEEVAIGAIPLAVKSPRIVDWKIHKEGKKSLRSKEVFGSIILVFIKLLMNKIDDFEEEYQVWMIVRIKSLLDAVRITATQVFVNTALMKLVPLRNFKKIF